MCGKFTAMMKWREYVNLAEATSRSGGGDDPETTYRVMSNLPVIIWDEEAGKRRVVPMRWGFPDARNWRIPKPIHARSETIETTKAFAPAFLDGQRGIVIMKTFNEAPDIEGSTIQHTITPGDSAAIGIAFVWCDFTIPEPPGTMRACVMVTVAANALIATLPTDRMPAVLADDDWAIWLGEQDADVDRVKSCLKTVEGVRWTMTKEEKKASPQTKRGKPTVSDPGGFL